MKYEDIGNVNAVREELESLNADIVGMLRNVSIGALVDVDSVTYQGLDSTDPLDRSIIDLCVEKLKRQVEERKERLRKYGVTL